MSKDYFIHRAGTAEIMPDGFHQLEGAEKLARDLAHQNPGVEFYVATRYTRFCIDAPRPADDSTAIDPLAIIGGPARAQNEAEPQGVVGYDPAELARYTAEARAQAFDDAASLIRVQHRHGGAMLRTEQECLRASWAFSNHAYLIRQEAGLPQPSDDELVEVRSGGLTEAQQLQDKIAALEEEIELLRARWPRRYIMPRASEWVRLMREVKGYLTTCRGKCGSDIAGREYAIAALGRAEAMLEGREPFGAVLEPTPAAATTPDTPKPLAPVCKGSWEFGSACRKCDRCRRNAPPEKRYEVAVALVREYDKPSASFIQRKLQIGYNAAATLIERMEQEGVVSPPNSAGARTVLKP